MSRFKNSNRHATDEMSYVARRRVRKLPRPDTGESALSYWRRIGSDFAMI